MKKLAATLGALGFMGSAASAADIISDACADSLYVGLHGGIASLDADWSLETPGSNYSGDVSDSGFVGGIHGGYNHVCDQLMLGIEADLSFTDAGEGFDGFEGIGVETDFLGSVRGRLGWNIDNFMPFLTAGVAFGDFEYSQSGTFYNGGPPAITIAQENDSRVGFVGGGGIDIGFAPGWSGRAEILFYDFGSASGTFSTGDSYDIDSNVTVVRAGLTYEFGM